MSKLSISGKFQTGEVVATPGAMALEIDLMPYLQRHTLGDWGDLDDEDKNTNKEALKHGLRLLSAYNTPNGKIWIITEWDRSVTTVLLPEEY